MTDDDDPVPGLLILGAIILIGGLIVLSAGAPTKAKDESTPEEEEDDPCDECGEANPPRCSAGHCCTCDDCRCESCGHGCNVGYGNCISYCESCYDSYSYTD